MSGLKSSKTMRYQPLKAQYESALIVFQRENLIWINQTQSLIHQTTVHRRTVPLSPCSNNLWCDILYSPNIVMWWFRKGFQSVWFSTGSDLMPWCYQCLTSALLRVWTDINYADLTYSRVVWFCRVATYQLLTSALLRVWTDINYTRQSCCLIVLSFNICQLKMMLQCTSHNLQACVFAVL